MKCEIELPDGKVCTGCPCQVFLPPMPREYCSYGCALLHVKLKTGGEYDNYAKKHKNCPALK
uniref:Uncharacterized protein n=1 Tax=viral metagenome TaxID=1070528 RepID=A0A6M3JDX1_9ZZZZ